MQRNIEQCWETQRIQINAVVANDAVLLLFLCCYGVLQRTDNIGLVFVLDFLGVQN